MRIAGGEFKGRILKVPKTSNIRPSTERTREAIFAVLGDDVIDANVADLFCGSGALGLEALSRGASRALFVDLHQNTILIVRENIELLELDDRARAIAMNVMSIRPGQLQDINLIFADPPYHKGLCDRLIELLSLPKFDWYGILILEHEVEWSYRGTRFEMAKRIDFGDTSVTFLLRLKPKTEEKHED